MPTDPQQQLDALKRNLCGDCGVGPFKGGRRGGGWRVSGRAAWWIVAAALAVVLSGVALLALL